MKNMKFSLTAAHLRILALALMLIDHTGRVLFPSQIWMICLGRLAFPIFAFQIAEGYRHTHDFRRYCMRLALFAFVSEIPFDLMVFGEPLVFGHQNVMLTLLLGLLSCRAWDRKDGWGLIFALLAGALTRCDYGFHGVLTVLLFHVCRDREWELLLGMILICISRYGFPSVQLFSVLAWLPIRLYNGEKGPGGKWLQYAAYIFYPAHMLILGLL